MCDKATFDVIAELACREYAHGGAELGRGSYLLNLKNRAGDTAYDTIGRTLMGANAMGQKDRYGDDSEIAGCADYKWQPRKRLSLVEMVKTIQCYEYQACEWDGWKDSQAKQICDRCLSALLHSLPGYDAVPWGVGDAEAPVVPAHRSLFAV